MMKELLLHLRRVMVGSISMFLTLPAMAKVDTLMEEYHASLSYDSTYLQAKADYNSAKESTLAAWSAFFPQLSASGNLLTSSPEKLSTGFSVTAQQTIFNWSSIRQISVAKAQVRHAVEFLSASEQDLMRRVSSAYFSVVRANALVEVMRAQLKTMVSQLRAVRERYKVGHATITDLDRVQASYDLYRSQMVTVKMNLSEAKQALSEMTGRIMYAVPELKFNFKPVKPLPVRISVWQHKVNTGNLSIKTENQAVEVAKANISVKRGGYFPSVTVNGAYYPDKYGNTNEHFVYGLNVSFNAFQGGYTFAEVGQATAQYQKRLAQRDAAVRAAQSLMKNSFNGMLQGVDQIEAERLAVKSNQSALEHTEKGYVVGTQTILDVLDQQNKLFEAERTYVDGRIHYLNSVILLEQAAGTLKPVVLAGIQHWLQ